MDLRKVGPAPLDPKVAKKLLDLLSTDDSFRRRFKKDALAALIEVGYEPPPTVDGYPAANPGICIQLNPDDKLASKKSIIEQRAKLERIFGLPWSFDSGLLKQ